MMGVEHDIGGHDGNEGDITIPIPISKGVAYRFPFGGNYYYGKKIFNKIDVANAMFQIWIT